MRAVVQRVSESSVSVDNKTVGSIDRGILILLGIAEDDSDRDADYLAEKIAYLRIFEDEEDKMNLSVLDIKGKALVISQFTLLGDCRKGRRPSYAHAAKPELAIPLYEKFIEKLESYGIPVEKGIFQAMMKVHLINDGPVTLMIDSKKIF
jgi:D-aminoacyl-tRNA deacylase